MTVTVAFSLTLPQIHELKTLLENRKTQLEAWILAKHTSEEEREACQSELTIVQTLRTLFE